MKTVATDELEVGAELAKDVLDPLGRKLVSSGVVVTTQHLRAFKMWGVREVYVTSEDPEVEVPEVTPLSLVTPEQWETARARVSGKFRLVDANQPAMAALLQVAINRMAIRILQEERRARAV